MRRTRGVVVLEVAVCLLLSACASEGAQIEGEAERDDLQRVACDAPLGLVLLSQTVPSATLIPCITSLPPGWSVGRLQMQSGRGVVGLDSDLAGIEAAQVVLTERCDLTGAKPDPARAPDEEGTEKYIRVLRADPAAGLRLDRHYVFTGGCVTYRYAFRAETPGSVALEMDEHLSFVARSFVADKVKERSGQQLCGAGTSCVG